MRSDRRNPRSRPLAKALPWLLVGILVAGIGVPSSAYVMATTANSDFVNWATPAPAAAGSVRMSVNLTDRPAFSPSSLTINISTTLTLNLSNVGNYTHTFTLVAEPGRPINTSWNPSQLSAFFAANPPRANASLAGGQQTQLILPFNATSYGSYEFVSTVPYQFQAGMYGFLQVLRPVGPPFIAGDNTTDTPSFLPNAIAVNTTESGESFPIGVAVLVTNTGSFGHTFTLAPQSNVSLSVANYSSYFAQHLPLANVSIPAGAGLSAWANFTVSGPGIYEYICLVSGHFLAGMLGHVYVDLPVPPPPPPLSSAIVQGWILVGAAVIVGIGVAVALAAAYSGRMPPKPPGEHGS